MTPEQCKAARALLRIEQKELADKTGIARATIIDFEKAQREPRRSTVDQIKITLEQLGIDFIPENGAGAGVRLRDKK